MKFKKEINIILILFLKFWANARMKNEIKNGWNKILIFIFPLYIN